MAAPALPLALLLALPLLAGCLAAPGPGAGGTADDGGLDLAADLPAACDPARPAVAHRPGGVAVDLPGLAALEGAEGPDTGAAPVPCLSKTGFHSREPTIGIAADGTLFHYPAMVGDNTQPTGVAVSRDGGATWNLSLPAVAGVATHPVSFDPYLYLDPVTDRVFASDIVVPPNCKTLSWSDDLGATWDHTAGACTQTDHQTIFAGPPVTSETLGYPNLVYECAINAVALAGTSTMTTCHKSLDGGLTWVPTGEPAFVTPVDRLPEVCHGASGHGFVDGNGTVYLPKGLCDEPWLAISDDEGQTWQRVRVSDRTISGHDAGVAADPAGNVYYFFVAGEDRLPYLTVSRDGGETWSEPVMVGAPGVNEASQPEMIVGGEGRLAFVYMGTTNSPGAPFEGDYDNVTWNAYIGATVDALADEPLIWSAPVNDPVADPFVLGTCGSTRCQGVQDFMDVRIGPNGTAWGAFVDDCLPPGTDCLRYEGALEVHRVGAVGWLSGLPSLWGPDDANGPYPD